MDVTIERLERLKSSLNSMVPLEHLGVRTRLVVAFRLGEFGSKKDDPNYRLGRVGLFYEGPLTITATKGGYRIEALGEDGLGTKNRFLTGLGRDAFASGEPPWPGKIRERWELREENPDFYEEYLKEDKELIGAHLRLNSYFGNNEAAGILYSPTQFEGEVGYAPKFSFYDTCIEDTDLEVKIKNILDGLKIVTVRDLCTRNEKEILSYRGCGRISLKKIKDWLESRDLSLSPGGKRFY